MKSVLFILFLTVCLSNSQVYQQVPEGTDSYGQKPTYGQAPTYGQGSSYPNYQQPNLQSNYMNQSNLGYNNYGANYPQQNEYQNNYYNQQDPFNSGNYRGDDFNTPSSPNDVDSPSYYGNRDLDYSFRPRCPQNWILFQASCYRFMKSPLRPRNEARKICQAYESDLLSINSVEEHGFIINELLKLDPQHRKWYISARQQSPQYWTNDGDGTQMSNMENAFLKDDHIVYQQDQIGRDYLVYKFSDITRKWGFEKVDGYEPLLFVCEAPVNKLKVLVDDDRSFTYGLNIDDPNKIPRGPYFIRQPEDKTFDLSKRTIMNEVQLKCLAGGYPAPTYAWYKEEYEFDKLVPKKIDPLSDSRYTVSGGTLIIYNPENIRDGSNYHCIATNKYGSIKSESVLMSFGYIREFNLKRSSEQGNQYWGKVLYCDPPPFYPSVNYYWSRDYFPNFVEEDERVFVSNDGGLYFTALEPIDRGIYSCNVKSRVSDTGRNGPFFNLYVYPHADFQQLKFPNNFPKAFPDAPVVGHEVRLECMAFGYPVPSYNWTRTGGSIPRHAQLSSFGRILTIPSVSIEDEGEYACTITNDRASINNTVVLKVQAYPNFTIPLLDKHMDNKGDLTWTCEAFGVPDVNYTWWKNGERLTMDTIAPEDRDRYHIQDNILTIKYLDPTKDPGMYQCGARNQLKTTYSSAQLRVLSLKPSFKKRPLESETYGAEGGNVTIACNPEAAPKPTFTWKKDNNVIGGGGPRRILENGNLVISPVSRDDEGVYTCAAKNQYGSDESLGRLIVLRAPRFIEPLPPRINTLFGQSLFLHCNAETDEILDTAFIWNHNGMRIKEVGDYFADKRLRVNGGQLDIFNVSLSDAGEYECVVQSAVGRISSRMHLTIEGPPGPPGGLQVINIQKTSATLQWTDGASNGKPITQYFVTGRTNWNSTWVNISDHVYAREIDRYTGRKEAMVENALTPWSVYEFRVQSYNELGYSSPSSPSPQHSTPSDKPYEAPTNVGGGGGKIGDLTITWDPLPPSKQNGPNIHYKIFWRKKNDTEYQSLQLKEYGNIGVHVVSVPQKFFYTEYEVRVQPINDVDEGPISKNITIFSAEDMPQVAPQQTSAKAFNSTSLNVTWLPVDQTRERIRGKLIGHRIKYWKKDNKEEESIYYLSRSTKNWALIVGLQPDTYYFVKCMAYNSAGEGPESERYMERTYRKAPQKPPSSVHVYGINPSTIRVVWRYVQPSLEEEPLIGYKVRVWEIDQDMSTANDTIILVGGKLEAYVTTLTPGKVYFLRVLAFSNGGDGRMSSPPYTFQMGDYDTHALGYSGDSAHITPMSFTITCLIGIVLRQINPFTSLVGI